MYRIILLLSFSLTTGIVARSQKLFSIYATTGSGVSYFRGSATASNTVLYRNGQSFPNSVDTVRNHFGEQSLVNFTVGAQANLKLPLMVLTVDALFEHSGGKLAIDSVYTPSGNFRTTGVHKRTYNNLSINPQLGKRITIGPASVRVSAGVDYCIKLSRGSQSDYTDLNGGKNSIGGSGDEPEVNDLRLTAGVAFGFNKWGLAISYKHGVMDYQRSGPGTAYSRLVHVRLLYRLLGV